MTAGPSVAEASALAGRVMDEVERAVVGKRETLMLVLAAILAKGHVLLEDFPGLGKTLAARSFAQALGLDFARAQFTPDLLPADLTGSFLYDQRKAEFEFRRGPLFTGLLLADEINRTPPKTQSALLEAMQERQVTVEGETFVAAGAVPRPRHRQPDRVRGHLPAARGPAGPVPAAGELRLPDLRRGVRRRHAPAGPAPGGGRPRPHHRRGRAARACRRPSRGWWSTRASAATASRSWRPPASTPTCSPAPRRAARSGLVLAARAFALLRGRDYVIPEDVKAVARSVLSHRITVKPELWMTQASGRRVVDAVLGQVPTPATLRGPAR